MANEHIKLVSQLRKATGCKIKDVIEAIEACEGDIEEAKVYLRKKGLAGADSKSHRETSEGLVSYKISEDKQSAVAVALFCETDFVAKNEEFQALIDGIASLALAEQPADVEALKSAVLPNGTSVADEIKLKISKFGENIVLGAYQTLSASEGAIVAYQHGDKICVLVALVGDESVGRDVAMHVAAMKPIAADRESLPAGYVDQQREIFTAQVNEMSADKPADIVAKIVEGKINKQLTQVVLTDQIFVKDPEGKQKVGAWLKSQQAAVNGFIRVVVGDC